MYPTLESTVGNTPLVRLTRLPGPGSNFVYADVDGNIGYHAAGALPRRRNYRGDVPVDGTSGNFEWDGYIPFDELPSVYNPPSGLIVSANQNTFPENFAYPLLATNLPEFWKRWHMSLTGWCRGYVYMPLVGATRNPYTAIIVTFVLVGLWHAGTIHWLAWGLWHGCGQAGVLYWSRIAQRKRITFFKTTFGKLLGWALTLGFVSLGGTLVTFYDKGDFMDSFRLMGRAFGIV